MKQPIAGGFNDFLNNTTTTPEYNCLMGGVAWNTTETQVCQCMPTAGTLGRLFVELTNTQGVAGASYTFTVMVDGSPSTLEVVIAQGSASGSDTGTIDVTAGQTVSLRCVASATDPTATVAEWTVQFIGTTEGESICLTHFATSTTDVIYSELQGLTIDTAAEVYVQAPIPTPGLFKKLYIDLDVDPGTSPDAYTIALRVGGATKNNTVTIVANNTSGNKTNVTDVVAAGNLVDFICTPVSTPSTQCHCAIGIVFVSDTDGESLIMGGSSSYYPSSSDNEFLCLCGTGSADWLVSVLHSLILECTVRNLYVVLSGSPGTGNSYTVSITKTIDTALGLTVTISGAATSGNDTAHSYDAVDGDRVKIKSVPASSPTARTIHIGLVAYIATIIEYVESASLSMGYAVTSSRLANYPRTASTSLGFDVSATVGFAITIICDTVLGFAVTASRALVMARSASNSLGFAVSVLKAMTRTASNSLGYAVSVLKGITKSASTTLGFGLTVSRSIAINRASPTPLGFNVTASRAIIIARSAATSLGFAVSILKAMTRTASISFGRAVTSSRLANYPRTAAVSFGHSVTASRALVIARITAVSLGFAVAASRALVIARTASNSLGFVVAASRAIVINRSAAASLGFVVTASRLATLFRTASVSFGRALTVSRAIVIARSASVSLGFSLTVSRLIRISRNAAITLGFYTVATTLLKIKRLIQTIGTNRTMASVGTNRTVSGVGTNRDISGVGTNRDISTPGENRDIEPW